ncbi:MAG: PQQ-binding-like beta-propeller repeat protein [Thermoguttaceae bacterium]
MFLYRGVIEHEFGGLDDMVRAQDHEDLADGCGRSRLRQQQSGSGIQQAATERWGLVQTIVSRVLSWFTGNLTSPPDRSLEVTTCGLFNFIKKAWKTICGRTATSRKRATMSFPRAFGFLLALTLTSDSALAQSGGYWPQFRGPDRSNVSTEIGLLKAWPKEGPPLLWKVTNLGTGMAPVSVAEGRIYTLAFRDGTEYAVALDRGTGKEIWTVALGPGRQEAGMQFHFQRQPVIDHDRLYAFSANAELFCLDVDAGQVFWKKDYRKDFPGKVSGWGMNDHPLVDGDRLICTPGGKDATLVALDKRTGEVVWKAVVPDGDVPAHSPVMVAEVDGVRQYVELLSRGLVGISAKDGAFLWRYNRASNGIINVPAPIVRGDRIFVSSGYGVGSALLKLSSVERKIKVEEVYFTKEFQNLNGGMVLVGDHIYGGHRSGIGGGPLACLEMKTGKVAWSQRGDFTNVLAADGHLYCRHTSGFIALVEATPQEYKEKGRFMQPDRSQSPAWTYLVLTGRRLYVRDQSTLLCYDLRADRPQLPKAPEKPEPEKRDKAPPIPDAIFVPSPNDVVEKMLDLAKVKKTDVVVDLGCGDGRMVVTAARKYGCKAVGYDIDEDCIKLSVENVKKNKVEDLVRILHEDVFKADLGQANVVTLYLLPHLNAKLIPQLEKMKPGSRIVSHAFDMKGIRPDKVIKLVSMEDGLEHQMFLWTVPLKKKIDGEPRRESPTP